MTALRALVVAAALLAGAPCLAKTLATRAPDAAPIVTLAQGEVARWSGLDARACVLARRKYPAVDGVCYFPFDVEGAPGRHAIAVIDARGKRHPGTAIVEKVEREHVDIELKDPAYIDMSPANQRRARREREAVLKLFSAPARAPLFSLPLAPPASPLPKNENDFGSLRTFNGKVESLHTGRDYPVTEGNTVRAIADGRVVLADDHFLTGNSVYIDHGDGLVSASFHMSALAVQTGDEVRRGQALGKVGDTGRTSGVHLHLGIRWLGARVDPQSLLGDPHRLHEVGEPPALSERKDARKAAEPARGKRAIRRDDEG
jgi:hypothetical protein